MVYTPNEIVRFMIDGADWLCETHFGKYLVDKDVEILDPATGTGTFICELLEHFRGQPAKLKHKYQNELHANEVAILPYYVANLNIEATYAAITGDYLEFPNLCFVDTLDNFAIKHIPAGLQSTYEMFGGVSEENVARIKRQNSKKISVIIGNPPYNANQANENDNNKNREYPAIDKRIKATYVAESTAQKTKLYDMYARFFRWASDRLSENGVLALITNRSFIESRTFDGFRKVVAQEFSHIYVVDLGGDVRANPKLSGTKHKVFGIQTGVAISFMVKRAAAGSATKSKPAVRPEPVEGSVAMGTKKASTSSARTDVKARVYYNRRPEMETAEEKLTFLANNAARSLRFEEVQPDRTSNWINLTNNDFDSLIPLASKETKAAKTPGNERAIFKLFSLGVVTARDEWVYGESSDDITVKVNHLIAEYASTRSDTKAVERGVSPNTRIKWSRAVKNDLATGVDYVFDRNAIVEAQYRPFVKRALYFDSRLNEMQYQLRKCFSTEPNAAIAFHSVYSSHPIAPLAIDRMFDYGLAKVGNGGTQAIPLYAYDASGTRHDNITDWGLKQFRAYYDAPSVRAEPVEASPVPLKASPSTSSGRTGKIDASVSQKITKEAIFHYCYAVLHDPIYREKYALNLKREFPRIPFYVDFWQWATWGEVLMNLHIGYKTVTPFALIRADVSDAKAQAAGLAPKAMLRADTSAGVITLDSETRLSGVPPEAWTYKLGNRSALEWILDQYKESRPKDPTIREKFDTYRLKDYKEKVIDLLMRVTTVSVDTVAITDAMRSAKR